MSEPNNNDMNESLAEDAEYLAAFEERENEPDISFDEMVKKLKLEGRI